MTMNQYIYFLRKYKKLLVTGGILLTLMAMIIVINKLNSQDKEKITEEQTADENTNQTDETKYYIKKGDTLESISNYFNITVEDLMLANNITCDSDLENIEYLIIPNIEEEIDDEIIMNIEYMVESNDTLESISKKYNVSKEDIIEANNITNPDKIYAGDILIIPNVIITTSSIQYSPDEYVKGIDISENNGYIDWNKLGKCYENGDFDYVIIRMADNYGDNGREFTLDKEFERNLSECNRLGIPYGVYVFSRGVTHNEINTETNSIINYINNNLNKEKVVSGEVLDLSFNLSLPFYMDCFEKDAVSQYSLFESGSANYDKCLELIDLWCNNLENAGYFTGVYCSNNFYSALGTDRLSNYSLWIAHYGESPVIEEVSDVILNDNVIFDSSVKSQQITEKGTIDGIDGYVDVSIADASLINNSNVKKYTRNNNN